MDYSGYRKLLCMVTELHVRGYQRIRIAPGMSASGIHWRCSVTVATNISNQHGARILSWETLAAHYSSSQGRNYFDWKGVDHLTPSGLARLFLDQYPQIAIAGRGADWIYAGWYLDMLSKTYPKNLPIVYADWELPRDCVATIGDRENLLIPLPPPGWGPSDSDGE